MINFLRSCGIPLADGKISLPANINSVFIDVGLSSNAPQSEYLLQNNQASIVFGFEPLPSNINELISGTSQYQPALSTERINKEFFLIPCALGTRGAGATAKFFVTTKDKGCSSLYQPTMFSWEDEIQVPVYRLDEFLELFPFDKHGVIQFLKIDAQGADLDIVSSAGNYLSKILIVTTEITVDQYAGIRNSTKKTVFLFVKRGFVPITLGKNYPRPSKFLRLLFRICCWFKGSKITLSSVDPTFFNLPLFFRTKSQRLNIKIT